MSSSGVSLKVGTLVGRWLEALTDAPSSLSFAFSFSSDRGVLLAPARASSSDDLDRALKKVILHEFHIRGAFTLMYGRGRHYSNI